MTNPLRIPSVTWKRILAIGTTVTVPLLYSYRQYTLRNDLSYRRDTAAVHQFFATSTPPADLSLVQNQLETYLKTLPPECPVAIITSGGTMVPLEKRTVRFIDNFSTGARGAALGERLLQQDYGVIFLYRQGSRRPFVHSIIDDVDSTVKTIVSSFSPVPSVPSPSRPTYPPPSIKKPIKIFGFSLSPEMQYAMDVIQKFTQAFETLLKAYSQQRYIEIPYTSVNDYLYKLKLSSTLVHEARKEKSLILLAAAVSDFYIPENRLTEHKIQSDGTNGSLLNLGGTNSRGLTIELFPVPKALYTLKKEWAPEACIISFKLETDPSLLLSKAWGSIQVSEMDAVIANILEKRYKEITIVRNPSILTKHKHKITDKNTNTSTSTTDTTDTTDTTITPTFTIPTEPMEQVRASPTGCTLTDRWQTKESFTSTVSSPSLLDKLFAPSTMHPSTSASFLIPSTDIQVPVTPPNKASPLLPLLTNQPLEDALALEIIDIHHYFQHGTPVPKPHTPPRVNDTKTPSTTVTTTETKK